MFILHGHKERSNMSRGNEYDDWSEQFAGEFRGKVSKAKSEGLITEIQAQVADMIASAIDAGSERDAVNEDEELNEAIRTLVHGWIEVERGIE